MNRNNKMRLLLTLIISVLMVCSSFAAVYAEGQPVAYNDHQLNFVQNEGGTGPVQIQCAAHTGSGCAYSDVQVEISVADAFYSGYAYDWNPNDSLPQNLPDGISLADAEFYQVSDEGAETSLDTIPKDAGKYRVKCEIEIDGVGTGCFVSDDFEIKPRPLKVTAQDVTMTFGSDTPDLDFTVEAGEGIDEPLVGEDTKYTVFAGFLFSEASSNGNVGSYPIDYKYSLGGIEFQSLITNDNYTIETFVPGTFTIEKAAADVKVTVKAESVVYGTKVVPLVKVGNNPLSKKEYSVSCKNLDRKTARWIEGIPTAVGHYKMKVDIPATQNYDDLSATAEFEIRKVSDPDSVTVGVIFFEPGQLMNIDIANKSIVEIMVRTVDVNALVNGEGQYGRPIVPLVLVKGDLYDPLRYGLISYKYEMLDDNGKVVKSKPFVPGVTLLDAGHTYRLAVRIGKGPNNELLKVNSYKFTVTKGSPSVLRTPAARDGLAYNGKDQRLVTSGKATGGKFVYSLEKDGEYTEKVPRAKEAGDYSVFYKIKATNKNYISVDEPQELKVVINEEAVPEADEPDEPDSEDAVIAKPVNVKVYAGLRSFKVRWDKPSKDKRAEFDKVEIQFSRNKSFSSVKKKFVKNSKNSIKVRGLRKGVYYVRVRNVKYNNLKIIENGVHTTTLGEIIKEGSDWSAVKKVKVL